MVWSFIRLIMNLSTSLTEVDLVFLKNLVILLIVVGSNNTTICPSFKFTMISES